MIKIRKIISQFIRVDITILFTILAKIVRPCGGVVTLLAITKNLTNLVQ
jgi:hypothetical protein